MQKRLNKAPKLDHYVSAPCSWRKWSRWQSLGKAADGLEMLDSLLTGQRGCRDRCIPTICKSPGGCCFSISTSQPFFTAWATLPKCLFHIKDDAAQTVTLINAFKNTPSSALSPSPFLTRHKWAEDKTTGGEEEGATSSDRLLPVVENAFVERPLLAYKK